MKRCPLSVGRSECMEDECGFWVEDNTGAFADVKGGCALAVLGKKVVNDQVNEAREEWIKERQAERRERGGY